MAVCELIGRMRTKWLRHLPLQSKRIGDIDRSASNYSDKVPEFILPMSTQKVLLPTSPVDEKEQGQMERTSGDRNDGALGHKRFFPRRSAKGIGGSGSKR
ncbi:MAG: hypothetical protein HKL81_03340 [Acidimicrobiaceae bacterium]|nr:hypothetical protein [Acidimicrobiaceae bacterium]